MKSPVYEMPGLWNVVSMKWPVYEMSIYEMSIYEMSYLWFCYLCNFHLLNVLSMKCSVYEMSIYEMSIYEMSFYEITQHLKGYYALQDSLDPPP